LTLNRLTVTGWNSINIGILVSLIVTQIRAGREGWIEAVQAVFGRAANAYLAWGLSLLIAVPIVF
jgi:hypothetical protein